MCTYISNNIRINIYKHFKVFLVRYCLGSMILVAHSTGTVYFQLNPNPNSGNPYKKGLSEIYVIYQANIDIF